MRWSQTPSCSVARRRPTPVDAGNQPDLGPVIGATRSLAALLDPAKAPIIVYESTVYPGVTEEVCGPLIEEVSGLRRGGDFFLGNYGHPRSSARQRSQNDQFGRPVGFGHWGGIALCFDFEWTNKNLFYGFYKRSSSYFSNSELGSSGLPSKEAIEAAIAHMAQRHFADID